MPSTSIPYCNSYYYPVPKHFFSRFSSNKILSLKSLEAECTSYNFLKLTATNSRSKEQKRKQNRCPETIRYNPDQESRKIFQDFNSYVESRQHRFVDGREESESVINSGSGISSNMWWADVKAAVGQRINLEGIACAVGILSKDKHLAIPHVSVPDIRHIDWAELKESGFKGVVFDKDNTITVPYCLSLWAPLVSSIEQCKSLFGDNIAVFSNSSGLNEYDPDDKKASALEDAIGIKVIRHRVKKPAGSAEEIEKHFGCESSSLIMVGDRPFTDIVYGNRNGFFTILTEPLSLAEEPLIVRQVRLLEVSLVRRWSEKGFKMMSHSLLPDSTKCVKDAPDIS